MLSEKKVITVSFFTIFFGCLSFSLPYPVFAPLFLTAGGGLLPVDFTDAQRAILLGVALTMFPLGQMIGNPLLGKLSDKKGRKKVLVYSLTGTTLSYVLVAIAITFTNLYLLLFARFVTGLCQGTIALVQSIATDVSTGETKTRNLSWLNAAVNSGWVFGAVLGGQLAGTSLFSWGGYTVPFWSGAALAVFNIVLVMLWLPETKKFNDDNTIEKMRLRDLFKQPQLKRAYIATFASFTGVFLFFTYYSPYSVRVYHLDSEMIGLFAAFISLPLLLGNYLAVKLEKRWGYKRIGIVGHIIMALGLFVYVLPYPLYGLLLPITIVAIGVSLAEIFTTLAVSNNAPKQQQGSAMGMYRSVMVFGDMVGALSGGLLAAVAIHAPFYAGGIVCLLTVVIIVKSKNWK